MIYTSQPPSMAYGYASPASPWWPYAKYPDLHRGRVAGYCPSLGNTADRLWDFSGNGKHGTMMPTFATGPTWNVGEGRYANSFDGVNDYVDIPDSDRFDFGDRNFAVAVWVKATTLPSFSMIVAKDVFGQRQFVVSIESTGVVRLGVFSSPTTFVQYKSVSSTITTGAWYSIVAQRRGNISEIFFNGVSTNAVYDSVNSTSDYPHTMTSTTSNVNIGRRQFVGSELYFNGLLDDVQIYSRALSQNEITQLYQLGRGGSYAIDYEMMMEEAAAASRLLYLRRCGVAA